MARRNRPRGRASRDRRRPRRHVSARRDVGGEARSSRPPRRRSRWVETCGRGRPRTQAPPSAGLAFAPIRAGMRAQPRNALQWRPARMGALPGSAGVSPASFRKARCRRGGAVIPPSPAAFARVETCGRDARAPGQYACESVHCAARAEPRRSPQCPATARFRRARRLREGAASLPLGSVRAGRDVRAGTPAHPGPAFGGVGAGPVTGGAVSTPWPIRA